MNVEELAQIAKEAAPDLHIAVEATDILCSVMIRTPEDEDEQSARAFALASIIASRLLAKMVVDYDVDEESAVEDLIAALGHMLPQDIAQLEREREETYDA